MPHGHVEENVCPQNIQNFGQGRMSALNCRYNEWQCGPICINDGSEKRDCPQGCEIPVRDNLDSYFGTINGMVSCKGEKACGGEPCEGKCLSYKEWACEGRCINKTAQCNGKCQVEGSRPNFCEEKDECISNYESCGQKCLDPTRPNLESVEAGRGRE